MMANKAQKFAGIVLEKPFGEIIWNGKCREINIPNSFKHKGIENLYYMDLENCYGILRLGKMIKSVGKSKIYEIEIIDRFEDPKPIEQPEDYFIEDVKFMKEEGEEDKELRVVKKGERWCVVHGSPQKEDSKTDKPEGSIIKCFKTKEEADAMHKAITISKIKGKAMLEGNSKIELMSPYDSNEIIEYSELDKLLGEK